MPFDTAVKGKGKTYSYHISPKLFMDYTGCDADVTAEEARAKAFKAWQAYPSL